MELSLVLNNVVGFVPSDFRRPNTTKKYSLENSDEIPIDHRLKKNNEHKFDKL